MSWFRDEMAARAAQELRDGAYVNLGIGLPTLVANHILAGMDVWLQARTSARHRAVPDRGRSRRRSDQCRQADRHRARRRQLFRQRIELRDDPRRAHRSRHTWPAGSHRARRPRHLDGAGKMVKGMGGAMDLVSAVERVVVLMEHTIKIDEPKILPKSTLRLTGVCVVNRIVTELGVLDVTPKGLNRVETATGVTADEFRAKTGVIVH